MFNGVSPSQLRQSSLELTVWDQAIFGVNDRLLGEARLSSGKSERLSGLSGMFYPSQRSYMVTTEKTVMLPRWQVI